MTDRIRQAASVVAVRDAGDRPEVLVLERSAASRFLPSYVVFPGGAVDEDDAVLAERWFGSVDEAPRAAAVRELVEEAGLALTANGLVPAGSPDAMDTVEAFPPESSQLRALCHWIAPEDVPVRFDARYFVLHAPGELDPTPDGDEAVRAWWVEPRRLMA
ncbi:MAG TPA: NUDIX domain-containing protein, partial [Actinomycetota bacterium]|nr:NUDIX domain-containing protein [Actinomycetota bacterium]